MKQTLHESTSPSLWAVRDLRIALPARALSVMGDTITVAVLALAVSESGDASRLTALFMAFGAPILLLAGVAGRLADRYDSRRVLVAGGLLQAAASLGLVVGPDLGSTSGFAVTLALVAVLQAGQAVTGPAWSALVPRIVGDELVGRAIGLQMALSGVGGLIGMAVGGLLFDAVGYHGALLVDTATFVVLVAAGWAVRARRMPLSPAPHQTPSAGGGLAYVRRDAVLRLLLPALLVVVLAGEGVNVVEPLLVTHVLGGSGTAFGWAGAAFAAGTIAGSLLGGRFDADARRLTGASVAILVMGLGVAATGRIGSLWMLFPLGALLGCANGVVNALVSVLALGRTLESWRGRVMAVLNGAARGASILALALGGALGTQLGPRGTFITLGLLLLAVAPAVLVARRGLASAPGGIPEGPVPSPAGAGELHVAGGALVEEPQGRLA
ncbi:hypothetical protein N865_13440 [Intrasporangium oryzae NRRL B-24470]|uniref:Major facilitator superfamily (MFS) profile domain-containing protein n=1 Tax=Intrasporangium oryzae NRRL B-24470 TaxID=1386089 RepID=W9G4A2_9MICO|nr:MFS transporter [Intrasporangium oryzae]EWT00850.1 hypothetical protein N865_13440 [Intrasporangium oryzae NRRL B-24470]